MYLRNLTTIKFSTRVLCVLTALTLAGCGGGGGGGTMPEPSVLPLALPADHGLPAGEITVAPGESEEHGNVVLSCPAGGQACVLNVADDGSASYAQTGGMPAIVPRPPLPDSVEQLLQRRLLNSTWPVAVSFGGGVATCAALGCPVADAIHVDRGDARHPSDDHRPDLSGFEPLEPRRGIALASKAQPVVEGQRSAFHRAFGAWMDHGFFLVETFAMHGNAGLSHYHTTWFGDASHSSPLTSPGDTATWSGVMSGVESSPSSGSGAFVHGDSAVTVSGLVVGAEVSVEVAFTSIVNQDTGAGIGDMVWRGLPLQGREFGTDNVLFNDAGYFQDESFGAAAQGSLYGRLYGPGHEEVGGLFHSNGIAGAFAGKRDR